MEAFEDNLKDILAKPVVETKGAVWVGESRRRVAGQAKRATAKRVAALDSALDSGSTEDREKEEAAVNTQKSAHARKSYKEVASKRRREKKKTDPT